MHFHTITKLLDLPNVIVIDALDCGDNYHHLIAKLSDKYGLPVCSGCGAVLTSVHSKGPLRVEDQPVSGRRVFLYLEKRKCRCPEGGICAEFLPWLHGRFTRCFAEQVYRLTSITTNAESGCFLGLDDEVVYRIDRAILQEKDDDLLVPPPPPKAMSVDEVAWEKGHSYVTNVVDIDKRVVIWNHDKHGKTVLDAFYESLAEKEREKIDVVACDGANGFLSSTRKHAKNSLIVLDHFHVKAYLNTALEEVRKQELAKAKKNKYQEELADLLHCKQRFIIMRNKPSRKKIQVLKRLEELNEPVYKAMLLKEQFASIYEFREKDDAQPALRAWIGDALRSGLAPFKELSQKLLRKRHYILNFFIRRITSAISEGINNKIKRLKRMAYGYKDVAYFLLKIH
ncbi:ISL3 family transposase [bacterium]|nr:ISL3 family transposase [bacterium]